MSMKYARNTMFLFAFLVLTATAWAIQPIGGGVRTTPDPHFTPGPTTSAQCTLTYISPTYGSYSGKMTWPDTTGYVYLTGHKLLNSCTPGETLFTYCVDLDHFLVYDPYCVNVDSVDVRDTPYEQQYPAMAYVMTWYPVTTAKQDRIMQLSIWKLSNDERDDSPTLGSPWYFIDAGRDPGFPYVNTVFNSDTAINNPANTRIKDALGYGPDGMAKNVIVCGDQLNITPGATHIIAGMAYVPLTITLTRGAEAQAVNNTSLSGVKLQLSVVDGYLSDTEMFTDEDGEAHVVVSKEFNSPVGAVVTVCTYGLWPRKFVPCLGYEAQQLIEGKVCTLCVNLPLRPDDWTPVELAAFDVASVNGGVRLAWRTASETDLDHWEIERRLAGATTFQTIGTTPAANRPSGSSYAYTDQTVQPGTTYEYRLADVSLNGDRTVHTSWIRSGSMPLNGEQTPQEFSLSDNFPNPFNPETTIRFTLPEAGTVTLKVYDVTGKEVAVLMNGETAAGSHNVTFRANDLPSGLYFYTFTSGSFSETKKMVLMK
jgi:hypothetical protein